MTRLFLCEKPSQARDIAAVLGARVKGEGCLKGDGVAVTWCIGHLLEMAPPEAYDLALKRWDIAQLPIIPGHWKLEVTSRGKAQFNAVKASLTQASEVVIATDADREGETIGREVLERCGWRGPIRRLWLSALDEASIRKALANLLPGEKTEPLYQAGLGRARADWLVGMNLSRLYTLVTRGAGSTGVVSVGRVQTPTLSLVVDRDREIEGFKSLPYFEVMATFATDAGTFRAKWQPGKDQSDAEGRCTSRPAALQVAQQVQGQEGHIAEALTKRVKEPPPLPFDLSGLQQEASRRWGMGVQQLLDIAQALYETHKAATYPRTDCAYLPESQFADAAAVIRALKKTDGSLAALADGADTQRKSRAWSDARITAHHAIIPTAAPVDMGGMSETERRVYDLIRRRYLAQFYPDHEYDQTTITAQAAGETFRATGRMPRVAGWKAVISESAVASEDGAEDAANQVLPPVTQGDAAKVVEAEVVNRHTKPPARYTEGTLIAAMKSVGRLVQDAQLKAVLKDTSGIGTEATRASIIETLLKRGFIVREGRKHLVSTSPGRALIDAVPNNVKDPATTARWEQALDEIAHGKGDLGAFLGAQAQWLEGLVKETAKDVPGGALEAQGQDSEAYPCPECGKLLRRRSSQRGWFWGCTGYPDCRITPPDVDGRPGRAQRGARDAEIKNNTPPSSGKDQGAAKSGERSAGGAGIPCPTCGNGRLVRRIVKNGKNAGRPFLGCTSYPRCDYFAWAKNEEGKHDKHY
ncbi:MAG: DNA topoisomerase 3 [Pseudomonadota bacterium]